MVPTTILLLGLIRKECWDTHGGVIARSLDFFGDDRGWERLDEGFDSELLPGLFLISMISTSEVSESALEYLQ